MKTVMAVLVVLPALVASALPARAQSAGAATLKPAMTLRPQFPCGDRHPIQPLNGGLDRMPYGPDVPCPEFPGPEPLPFPGPHRPHGPWIEPVKETGARAGFEKSAVKLGAAKAADRSALLAGMFDGSVGRADEGSAAVFAGASELRFAHMDPSMPDPSEKRKKGLPVPPTPTLPTHDGSGARIVLVGETGAAATVAGAVVHEIVRAGIEKANEAATRYVERDQTKESIEKYGGCRLKGTCDK